MASHRRRGLAQPGYAVCVFGLLVLPLGVLCGREPYSDEQFLGERGCTFCNVSHMVSQRKADALTHMYATIPVTEGNHNPSFLRGPDITLFEDFGAWNLGVGWVTNIDDGNQNDHQNVRFDMSNSNGQLFDVQPQINVCHPNCDCQCPNQMGCGDAGICGCGMGCGTAACGGDFPANPAAMCPLQHQGTLKFSVSANKFGVATVEVVLIDDGIAEEVCDEPVMITPGCQKVPCARLPCTHSSVVEFKITVLPVNDPPDFSHLGDVESDEDTLNCVTRWAYDITAGGWGEEYGQANGQILTFRLTNSNPNLFITQPYLRYMQGDEWADLCYQPAPDQVGEVTVEVFLSDDGGDLNGGRSTRIVNPELFKISVLEANDPPFFTQGPSKVVVEEDSGGYNQPWATGIKPGPGSEQRSMQQLDRFVVSFENSADMALFEETPTVDVENGFLRFRPAKHANTLTGPVRLTVHLWDLPDSSSCRLCTPLRSLAPHASIELAITPVNDPPSFTPITPSDIRLTEDQGFYSQQWGLNLCVGGVLPNDCVVSEADAGRENQRLVFSVTLVGGGGGGGAGLGYVDPFTTLEITPEGILKVEAKPDVNGNFTAEVVLKDTGPPPNTFADKAVLRIQIDPVNDRPYYNTSLELLPGVLKVPEDTGRFVQKNLIVDLRAGPVDEESQILSFDVVVENPGLFEEPPVIVPRWHHSGRLHGDLFLTTKPDVFGETSVRYTLYDNGGPFPENSTESREFAVEITPVNDPPSFDPPDSLVFYEGGGNEGEDSYHVLNFIRNMTPGAGEEAVQRMEYTIVPSAAVFTDDPKVNQYGSLTFAVEPNWWGTLTLNISAVDVGWNAPLNDSLTTDSYIFQLSILAVNDPPVFTLSQATLRLPVCRETPGPNQQGYCQHILTDWIGNLSPGPHEGSTQSIASIVTKVVASDRGGVTLSEEPAVEGGVLYIRVAAMQLEDPFSGSETHQVELSVRDTGGVSDGGHDTSRAVFYIVVTTEAIGGSVPDLVLRVFTEAQPSQRVLGDEVVTGPTFRIVDTAAALPGSPSPQPTPADTLRGLYNATVQLHPLQGGPSFALDPLASDSPYLYQVNLTNASLIQWGSARVPTPGVYYFEVTVRHAFSPAVSGSAPPRVQTVSNRTEVFAVEALGTVSLAPAVPGAARVAFPDEPSVARGGATLRLLAATNPTTKAYNETALQWNLQDAQAGPTAASLFQAQIHPAASGSPAEKVEVTQASVLRTLDYPNGELLEVTFAAVPGLSLGGRDGVFSLDFPKTLLQLLDLRGRAGGVTSSGGKTGTQPGGRVGVVVQQQGMLPMHTALVVTSLRFPIWSPAELEVLGGAAAVEAAAAAPGALQPQGLANFVVGPRSSPMVVREISIRAVNPAASLLGGGGNPALAGGNASQQQGGPSGTCCAVCTTEENSVYECCKSCFREVSHFQGGTPSAQGDLRSAVAELLRISPIAEGAKPLSKRISYANYTGYDSISAGIEVFRGEAFAVEVSNPGVFAFARDVTAKAGGAPLQVITPGDADALLGKSWESYRGEFLAFSVIYLVVALVSFPFSLTVLTEWGVVVAIMTMQCQPEGNHAVMLGDTSWVYSGLITTGAAWIAPLSLAAAHAAAAKLTQRHLFFPTLPASIGCILLPFAILSAAKSATGSRTSGSPPQWSAPLHIAGAVTLGLCIALFALRAHLRRGDRFVFWYTASGLRQARHTLIPKEAHRKTPPPEADAGKQPSGEADDANNTSATLWAIATPKATFAEKFVGPRGVYSAESLGRCEGGGGDGEGPGGVAYWGSDAQQSFYGQKVQRNLAAASGVNHGGGWFFLADLAKAVLVSACLGADASGGAGEKAQLLLAPLALLGCAIASCVTKVLWSHSPLLSLLRTAVSALQAAALLCVALPALTSDSSELRSARWASVDAFAPLLLTSLLISSAAVALHPFLWWAGQSRFRRLAQHTKAFYTDTPHEGDHHGGAPTPRGGVPGHSPVAVGLQSSGSTTGLEMLEEGEINELRELDPDVVAPGQGGAGGERRGGRGGGGGSPQKNPLSVLFPVAGQRGGGGGGGSVVSAPPSGGDGQGVACPACGSPLAEGGLFCQRCGAAV